MSKVEEILGLGKAELERAFELHKKSIVVDVYGNDPELHGLYTEEMIEKAVEYAKVGRNYSLPIIKMRIEEMAKKPDAKKEYAEIWKRAGVTCMVQKGGGFQGMARYNYRHDLLGDVVGKAVKVEDVERAKEEGKHCMVWNFNTPRLQRTDDVEEELDRLDWFYMCGVRQMGLTYNLRNLIGDGCTERYQSGLTYFGLKVVERMNKLGIIVDTAHSGYQTTLDAVEASKDPVIASHSTCRSVYDHTRGNTDEEIKDIAESGGYIGICVIPTFLAEMGNIKDFLDHIDYAVNLVGADHVAIGTDNEYRTPVPKEITEAGKSFPRRPRARFWTGFRPEHRLGLPQAAKELSEGSLAWTNWPYYTAGLVSRGYSDQEIRKIIGGNFLRVFKRVVG